MEAFQALNECDVGREEAWRRAGAGPSGNDGVRSRLGPLLQPTAGGDEPPEHTAAQDARRCGALIVRLGGAATPTVAATWMGWTMERTAAAVAELERSLDACGLQLVANAEGGLVVRERARLRRRPVRLPYELAQRLDAEEHLHALAHLARGDHCAHADEREQALLDLGAAIPAGYPGLHPSDVVAAAFVDVYRRASGLPPVIVITESGERWPSAGLWDQLRASGR